MKGEANPFPFAALSLDDLKEVLIYCWVGSERFPVVGWQSPGSNSRPSGDFLHHNRVALTTPLRRLSGQVEISIRPLSEVLS